MDFDKIKNVYFIGIGGIGMSALARYFLNAEKRVFGYDKTKTPLTSELQQMGMNVVYSDEVSNLPKDIKAADTLVVITPAVPSDHAQWQFFKENNFQIKKRAQVLGQITKDSFCFAVAGTHGKTTTSAILGHILFDSGAEVTAFLGGIAENYNSNLIGNCPKITVVEADEFDRSFLHLHPDMACITSTDADHLDIYGDHASFEAGFEEFASKITDPKMLFVTPALSINGTRVGVETQDEYSARNIRIQNGVYVFDAKTPSGIIADIKFSLPGRHNLSNAMMALSMAHRFGVKDQAIAKALESFTGIKRRFSFQIRTDEKIYIDDYAHHPTEIDAVCAAARELYPNDKILAVFQPHLFSRTRDFADEFARSLSQFDQLLLLDIYPAREMPIDGITSDWLLEKVAIKDKKLVQKRTLVTEILSSDARVILTIGAGDIGELVPVVKKALE